LVCSHLKDWVLLKIECTINPTCLRCLQPFKMADNQFAIVAGDLDDLEALLEGIDALPIQNDVQQQL